MSWFNFKSPWGQSQEDAPTKDQLTITALRQTLTEKKAELAKVTEQRDDYLLQVREHSASKVITPYQEVENTRIYTEHQAMKKEQDKLALWLRNNKREEMLAGKHTGMGLADAIIMYLNRPDAKESIQ